MKIPFYMSAICLCLSIGLHSCRNAPASTPIVNTPDLLVVSANNITTTRSYPAHLRGSRTVEIRPQVSGILKEIRIEEGGSVKKGEVLFIIDPTPYRAKVATAQAGIAQATAHLQSVRLTHTAKEQLQESNVLSDYYVQQSATAVAEAEAALQSAQAALLCAETELGYTLICSPVDGTAGMIDVREGALIEIGMPSALVTISDNSEIHAYFGMSEYEATTLQQTYGSIARFIERVNSLRLRMCNGNMYSLSGRIDAAGGLLHPQSGSLQLRAVFANPQHLLMDGGTCEIVMEEKHNNCIVIPQHTTWRLQDKTFVKKICNGQPIDTEIDIEDAHNGKDYIVTTGLNIGDSILIHVFP
ncbi:MAG: efflux RND transporter periplasmic adaptor subunit [Paludibacter sp.]|nr:efflux RND transporter periplasmic adaptor subunit [Bacteroidales bacterium]MCM1068856.1 efflux RND transporter periplasmic adaptor subunit [Prevotella sp.]MCM1353117.1 efflux RND transporter periplasmic adaptor subunit [Bacteroides sp.]MCM1442439.1 efflux RND transporter periplasmic adaptor subunit [Muribaculum sp.]MCM1481282.1 efflux RND transporter periplasmic adaptor subunit [Paludibacter sp.]